METELSNKQRSLSRHKDVQWLIIIIIIIIIFIIIIVIIITINLFYVDVVEIVTLAIN